MTTVPQRYIVHRTVKNAPSVFNGSLNLPFPASSMYGTDYTTTTTTTTQTYSLLLTKSD